MEWTATASNEWRRGLCMLGCLVDFAKQPLSLHELYCMCLVLLSVPSPRVIIQSWRSERFCQRGVPSRRYLSVAVITRVSTCSHCQFQHAHGHPHRSRAKPRILPLRLDPGLVAVETLEGRRRAQARGSKRTVSLEDHTGAREAES